MKLKGHINTTCPACLKSFSIHNNRTRKVQDTRVGMWFVDTMNQFEHFSEVTCPYCSNKYKASEARLFGVFKSPYIVFLIAGILGLIIVVWFSRILIHKWLQIPYNTAINPTQNSVGWFFLPHIVLVMREKMRKGKAQPVNQGDGW